MIVDKSSRAAPAPSAGVRLRQPRPEDGRRVYDAVCAWGGLDQNSAYAYLLACDRFAMQSALAERGESGNGTALAEADL